MSHFDFSEFDPDNLLERFTMGQVLREFAPKMTREGQLHLVAVLKEFADILQRPNFGDDEGGGENN
jgi:hypothetical protein